MDPTKAGPDPEAVTVFVYVWLAPSPAVPAYMKTCGLVDVSLTVTLETTPFAIGTDTEPEPLPIPHWRTKRCGVPHGIVTDAEADVESWPIASNGSSVAKLFVFLTESATNAPAVPVAKVTATVLGPVAATAIAQLEIPPILMPNPPCRVALLPPIVTEFTWVPVELQTKMTITTLATWVMFPVSEVPEPVA